MLFAAGQLTLMQHAVLSLLILNCGANVLSSCEPKEVGNELIVLLNDPWNFARARLYGSLFGNVQLCLFVLTTHQMIEYH